MRVICGEQGKYAKFLANRGVGEENSDLGRMSGAPPFYVKFYDGDRPLGGFEMRERSTEEIR
jgi:hypothetical protein